MKEELIVHKEASLKYEKTVRRMIDLSDKGISMGYDSWNIDTKKRNVGKL